MIKSEEDSLIYLMYSLLYVNDMACNSVQELEKYIKDKDKESRKKYGALKKRCNTYFSMIYDIIGSDHLDMFSEYCAAMDEKIDPLLRAFMYSINYSYKEKGVNDEGYLATIEFVRTCIDIAVYTGRRIVNRAVKIDPYAIHMKTYILEDALGVANSLHEWAYFMYKKDLSIFEERDKIVIDRIHALISGLMHCDNFNHAYSAFCNAAHSINN